jgi:hypothetical protein
MLTVNAVWRQDLELPTLDRLFETLSSWRTSINGRGEPYRDASGKEYLPMFVHPVLVYAADAAALRRPMNAR